MVVGSLTIPWVALISPHMRRTEGAFPLLSVTQLVAGVATLAILILPFIAWSTQTFRPDRDPELILLLSDFGWLFLVMTFGPFSVQLVSIGLAAFADKSTPPVFPRWAGYFNIWMAILFIPTGLVTFFKTGPFAWSGLIGSWIPIVAFSGWYVVMFFVMRESSRNKHTPLKQDLAHHDRSINHKRYRRARIGSPR